MSLGPFKDMKEIPVENIQWQTNEVLPPGIAALPLKDRPDLPKFQLVMVPENLDSKRLASYIFQYLENRYNQKVYSFSTPCQY